MSPGVANTNLTLYHKIYDPATRLDVWAATWYFGVSWHGGQAVAVEKDGLTTADKYTVRIYTDDPIAAAPGDIVCRGIFDEADPKAARRAAAESFVVTAVRDNRRGSPVLHHWRLEGK